MQKLKMIIAAMKVIFKVTIGVFFVFFLRILIKILLKPLWIRSKLLQQGIEGPPTSILYGNINEIKKMKVQIQLMKFAPPLEEEENMMNIVHNWPPIVFPHLHQWRDQYGATFLYSTGNTQILCITDPEMVKEVSCCTSLDLGKPSYQSTEPDPLLGRGILSSNGPSWIFQRKIIAQEFHLSKVKRMVDLMVSSTLTMVGTWEKKADSLGGKLEIVVDEDLKSLSADIISRACFGSSYAQGAKILTKLQALSRVMSKENIGVPGLRYPPNKHNEKIIELEREIYSIIINRLYDRNADYQNELLLLILGAAQSYGDDRNIPADISLNQFIVDNCKNIYTAGHETTANSASWCIMTLAAYPEWQARAREEVLGIFGNNIPTPDMLRHMKVLTMVIQETLRLYPPEAYVVREALQDINLKGTNIPKGVNIQVPIPMMHQHKDLWGPEVHQFKPDRFVNGISGACKIPQAYMPFGTGIRTCAGQNFAMEELKVILSLVLSKFSLSLSSGYQHSPVFRSVIQPEYGVSILLEKL